MPRFPAEDLLRHTTAALTARGLAEGDAATAASCLIEAELEGQGSHGLQRLPFLLRRLDERGIDPAAEPRVVREAGAMALLDGANGLGPVVGARAVDLAVERAREHGLGLVAVRRGNHLGSLGFYLRRLTSAGVIGICFSNTPPAMAPPGSRTPYLGTNPIAAGFPTDGEPVLVDLATSQVARGRILKLRGTGEPIPQGWALDAEGRPTTDVEAALGGSLVPLGGDKGFALALLVEAMTGVLAGAAVGPEVGGTFQHTDRESNVGHSFLAIDAERLAPGFRTRMAAMAGAVRDLGARVPGDRRHAERERRAREGVDVSQALVVELEELAGEIAAPRR
ncbi:MAG TPA: Ldh family oxidoreductase [Candidatus Dormibacteraeota bacterium]|jgi:LDH2 family malate/lactate/ureidoglycolate dehydrogenase|nr:Ldh family oxidoreductase [Candidatus Dormibacteraeota bacterium]